MPDTRGQSNPDRVAAVVINGNPFGEVQRLDQSSTQHTTTLKGLCLVSTTVRLHREASEVYWQSVIEFSTRTRWVQYYKVLRTQLRNLDNCCFHTVSDIELIGR